MAADRDDDRRDLERPEGDRAEADASRTGETHLRSRLSRAAPWLTAAIAAVGLILTAVLVLDDDGGSPQPNSASHPTTASPAAPPTTDGRVAPEGPGSDPRLTDPDVAATFSRSSPRELPTSGDGIDWTLRSGTWRATQGQAIGRVGGDGTALITMSVEQQPLRAQVALPDADAGAGLAFGIVSPQDFLAWVAVPGYATVNLVRVEAGVRTLVLNSGLTRVAPGIVLGVHLDGDTAELLANGAVVGTLDQADISGRLGLVAIGPASTARFDQFEMQYE